MADITLHRPVRAAGSAVRALLSLVALGTLVAGPPLALTRLVGWPLPTHIVADDIRRSLGGGAIADETVVKALACAMWLSWAYLMCLVALEVVAWASGQAARALPLAALVQPGVRQLVVTASLLLGTIRPAAAAQPVPPPAVVLPLNTIAPAPSQAEAEQQPEWKTCVVQRRDSLWKLAEQHLGDGLRWREIYELNKGIRQPDGRTLRQPDLIRPGWTLQLPILAEPTASPATPPELAPEAEPAHAPPADVAPPVVAQPEALRPTTSAGPAAAPATPDHDRVSDDNLGVPAELAGAGLLAVGLVLTLQGRRRQRRAAIAAGHVLPPLRPSTPRAEAAEDVLNRIADRPTVNNLDLALRHLAAQLDTADPDDVEHTRIEAVRVDKANESVEILLTHAIDAAHGPFEVQDGRIWTLPANVDLDVLQAHADRLTAPAPALATIGCLHNDPVLVDLEQGGLTITGDRAAGESLLWTIAIELATSPWADWIDVAVLGRPPAGLSTLDRLRRLDSADDLAPKECETDALYDAGFESAWAARVANYGDSWAPTIVVAAPDADLSSVPAGVSLVRWAPEPQGRTLYLAVETAELLPGGVILQPLTPAAEVGAIAELLDATAIDLTALDGVDFEDDPPLRPKAAIRPAEVRLSPDLSAWREEPNRILVRILGPVRIEGLATPLTSPQLKELLVYLACHPEGVTSEQIMSAIWPRADPSQTAFNNAVSKLRTHLGTDDFGLPVLPLKQRDRYWPGRYVVTDLHLVEAATDDCVASDLLRGEPFAGSRGFEWAYREGIAHRASILCP